MKRNTNTIKKPRAANRRPLSLRRKSDGELIAGFLKHALLRHVETAVNAGKSHLTLTIDLPALPAFAAYAVVELDAFYITERGQADTWEEACALLERLHGTQKRGCALQISGLDANGCIIEEGLLTYGVRRGM